MTLSTAPPSSVQWRNMALLFQCFGLLTPEGACFSRAMCTRRHRRRCCCCHCRRPTLDGVTSCGWSDAQKCCARNNRWLLHVVAENIIETTSVIRVLPWSFCWMLLHFYSHYAQLSSPPGGKNSSSNSQVPKTRTCPFKFMLVVLWWFLLDLLVSGDGFMFIVGLLQPYLI